MRIVLCTLLLAAFAQNLRAEDEPLIPPALNAVLPKITAGMKPDEVKKTRASGRAKPAISTSNWMTAGPFQSREIRIERGDRSYITMC
jgi:hypothetical protein